MEAGLRSNDRTMPEEINRLVTDQLADLLLTPSRDGDANLLREGVAPEKIRFVGNVMIDTLVRLRPLAGPAAARLKGLPDLGRYALVTLHRPNNVDDPAALAELCTSLRRLGERLPVIFPVHPRTRQRLEAAGLDPSRDGVTLLEPLGYLEFVGLMERARVAVTDSGGVQEETTILGVPCLTVRPNTERPVTITEGTNRLVDSHPDALLAAVDEVLAAPRPTGRVPEGWDGHAAERIAEIIARM